MEKTKLKVQFGLILSVSYVLSIFWARLLYIPFFDFSWGSLLGVGAGITLVNFLIHLCLPDDQRNLILGIVINSFSTGLALLAYYKHFEIGLHWETFLLECSLLLLTILFVRLRCIGRLPILYAFAMIVVLLVICSRYWFVRSTYEIPYSMIPSLLILIGALGILKDEESTHNMIKIANYMSYGVYVLVFVVVLMVISDSADDCCDCPSGNGKKTQNSKNTK